MSEPTTTERWTPRSTVAAIVEQDGRFLMVEEMIKGKCLINQPAGHLEENETFTEAMLREVLEETGYQVEARSLLGLYVYRTADASLTFHRVCFIASAPKAIPEAVLDEGIIGPRWMTRDEVAAAPNLRAPLVLQCIDDYLAGRSYPLDFIKD
ncbi:MAG TPA: NUDIX hydrolase [Marinobacterium sp.]|nr:NUDIX hydrolase [Marinobacterium sp.]